MLAYQQRLKTYYDEHEIVDATQTKGWFWKTQQSASLSGYITNIITTACQKEMLWSSE